MKKKKKILLTLWTVVYTQNFNVVLNLSCEILKPCWISHSPFLCMLYGFCLSRIISSLKLMQIALTYADCWEIFRFLLMSCRLKPSNIKPTRRTLRSVCLSVHQKVHILYWLCLIIMGYIFFNLCLFLQVEVTKYEALEALTGEVKLKQLLWDSLEEWENLENSWLQVILRGPFKGVILYFWSILNLKST